MTATTRVGICLALAVGSSTLLGSCSGDPSTPASKPAGDGDASSEDQAIEQTEGGKESASDAGGADAADDIEADTPTPPTCQSEQAALVAFVKANKTCSTDADCVYVDSRADIREACDGGFYLNGEYEKATFSVLEGAVKACLGPEIPICALEPFDPFCWHGRCMPKQSELTGSSNDACFAIHGGENECTLCACGVCFPTCAFSGPCKLLVDCTRQAGCLGTPTCEPSSPAFPCKAELDASGGPGSSSAVQYTQAVQCLVDWQCADECSNSDGG